MSLGRPGQVDPRVRRVTDHPVIRDHQRARRPNAERSPELPASRPDPPGKRPRIEHQCYLTYHLSEHPYDRSGFSPRHAGERSYRCLKMTDLTYTVMNNVAPPHAPRADEAPSADQG